MNNLKIQEFLKIIKSREDLFLYSGQSENIYPYEIMEMFYIIETDYLVFIGSTVIISQHIWLKEDFWEALNKLPKEVQDFFLANLNLIG